MDTKADAQLVEHFASRVPGVVSVYSTLRWQIDKPRLPRSDPRIPVPRAIEADEDGAAHIGTVAASLLTTLALGSALANPNGTARVQVFLARSDPGIRCDKVYPISRRVRTPAVLKGAVEVLLRGPTAAERRRRCGGWFSARTAGMLRSVRLSQGVAYIDFRDFRRVIPNASSSCGSSLLLAQLDRTADQFPTVRRAIYSFNGSRRAFYEWLQLSPP